MAIIGQDLDRARLLLMQGKLTAIPTETVYGLAANALDPVAVVKIFEVKNRPHFNPLILHVSSVEKARKLVKNFPEKAEILAKKFWPGPLTLVLQRSALIPDIVTAGLETVALRVPDHPLTLELLSQLDFPLAAPSANPSGYVSPTTPEHVQQQLGERISYILDGGKCKVGIESTIVKVTNDEVTLLRLGGTAVEEIENVVGKIKIQTSGDKTEAPGMLLSHYAPKKKLIIGDIEKNLQKFSEKKIGILSFEKDFSNASRTLQFILSPKGDLNIAAQNLFSFLRKLDEADVKIILAEPVPDEGLGKAINDRLHRAAAEKNQ